MNSRNYNAVTGMRRIFERLQRWGDTIEFLNCEVNLVEEKKRPALFLKMGELWQEKLGMPHQALTCYLKVIDHGFHRPTAERIMKIQEQVCDYQGLVDILEKDIRVTDKNEELIPKLLYFGHIQWKYLDHPDEAVEVYSKVLKLAPDQMEAIEALDELFTLQKKWKLLITILNQKRENLSDPQRLLVTHIKIAEIYDQPPAHRQTGDQTLRIRVGAGSAQSRPDSYPATAISRLGLPQENNCSLSKRNATDRGPRADHLSIRPNRRNLGKELVCRRAGDTSLRKTPRH